MTSNRISAYAVAAATMIGGCGMFTGPVEAIRDEIERQRADRETAIATLERAIEVRDAAWEAAQDECPVINREIFLTENPLRPHLQRDGKCAAPWRWKRWARNTPDYFGTRNRAMAVKQDLEEGVVARMLDEVEQRLEAALKGPEIRSDGLTRSGLVGGVAITLGRIEKEYGTTCVDLIRTRPMNTGCGAEYKSFRDTWAESYNR